MALLIIDDLRFLYLSCVLYYKLDARATAFTLGPSLFSANFALVVRGCHGEKRDGDEDGIRGSLCSIGFVW